MLDKKRGQISDTMTWVVATIIIIVILMIFIYASSVLAKTKVVSYKGPEDKVDLLETKTSLAFLNKKVSEEEKQFIENWIEEENK
jgi:competence protein ComGC